MGDKTGRQPSRWLVGLAVASLLLALNALIPAQATHEPANKVSASGGEFDVIPATLDEGEIILSETVKTSKTTDLIIGVNLECSITTDVTTIGSDDQKAIGTLTVWVEIDGTAVPVSSLNSDDGRVVFCNRTYQRQTDFSGDQDEDNNHAIRTFIETRNANSFEWLAIDVGSEVHTITVRAKLQTSATNRASAKGVIGNRTLIIEPTKAANDEAVTTLG